MERLVFYGDDLIKVNLPEHTRVINPPAPLAPLQDYGSEILRVLKEPIGTSPLREQVNSASRVTIAFDDPCLPLPPMKNDCRDTVISTVLEELFAAGVSPDRIKLVCATGLHRKWTPNELKSIVGKKAWSQVKQITNHDAEDEEQIVKLEDSPGGYPVNVNRLVIESDLLIYVNVNWTSMNGGWKSVMVGLGNYETISAHHNCSTLLEGGTVMDHRSHFHHTLKDMGTVISRHANIFTIETVLNNRIWGDFLGRFFSLEKKSVPLAFRLAKYSPQKVKFLFSSLLRSAYQPLAVQGGNVDQVHQSTLDTLYQQQNVDVEGQTDALILGMPNISPYAVFSRINPLLALNSSLGYMFNMHHGKPPVRAGGNLILIQPFLPGFHKSHHPSYVEFFEKVLPYTRDPRVMEEEFENDFATRKEYIKRYQYHHAYHGVHPFYVWYWCAPALEHLNRIIVVGAIDQSVTKRMGLSNAPNLEEAFAMTASELGHDFTATHLVMPPVFCTSVT